DCTRVVVGSTIERRRQQARSGAGRRRRAPHGPHDFHPGTRERVIMIKRRTFISTAVGATAAAALPRLCFGQGLAPFPLFDTHAHFYTNQPDKYPFNASGARYGAERMIAKAMANPMTPEAVFALWDKVGI